jgi:ATP-binding cassette subfamily F protein uup
LSFLEQRELETLPQAIEALEGEQSAVLQQLAEPEFYQQPGTEIAQVTARLEALQAELHAAYARWEELESV